MSILSHAEDPRYGFEKFRRTQLYTIAKLEKVPFQNGAPATAMREILAGANIDPQKYEAMTQADALNSGVQTNRNEIPNVPQEKLKALTEEIEETPVEVKQEIENVDYSKMTFQDLKKECKLQGIVSEKTDKKADLLNRLNQRAQELNGNIT